MSILAEFMILSVGDNRPPMLEKHLYDSWKSIMELYMQNKEHERMILEFVEHGLLIWPMIEENGVTRTKKYEELSATEKIQADAKVVLMANLSSYGLDVLSEVPHSENTHNDMLNQIVQYTNSFGQQDVMILSLFEQLSNQVANCNMVNKNNLIVNESLSAELERYKERVKLLEERQNVDLKLSVEQAFQLQTSHPNTDQSASSPVKIKAPQELPKEKVLVITSLKNNLRKFKGKDIVNNAAQVSNATTIAPGMYKLDPVTLAPKDKNNRETHIYYLKPTMEQAAILREIVKHAKSLNPLDGASYSACKYVKLIQELLGYVRDTCPDIHIPSEKLVDVTHIVSTKGKQLGSNTLIAPSSFSLVDLSIVKFDDDQIAKIMGYDNYQIWNITISRVYYIEGLGHNLFSVGQFCDLDLEVAFKKHMCFLRNCNAALRKEDRYVIIMAFHQSIVKKA
uniref:Integrase, catalytic region, zinc finger, CCHC-type, peptidase aspartic, catalytic n=1 Tax=Tanacetum cinerariifolium TaxID=118510 RepID=A0A699H3E1_TANCI|nr:integrase, catalytic region, zinc finger, CCHC-type, peptidase aspartic, catalytic [Tanacetum cinerariifolium]